MCGLWIGMGRVRVVSWAILSSPRRAGMLRRRGGQPLARPSGCCSPVSMAFCSFRYATPEQFSSCVDPVAAAARDEGRKPGMFSTFLR